MAEPDRIASTVLADLIFRARTYVIQIPIGIFTYWIWQAKKDWRRAPRDQAEALTEQSEAG